MNPLIKAAFGACLIPFGQLLYNAIKVIWRQSHRNDHAIHRLWSLIIRQSLSVSPAAQAHGWTT
jgi:hypothetical protein